MQGKDKRPGLGLVMVLLSGVCWASVTIISKLGIESGLHAITLNTFRMVIAVVVVGGFIALFKRSAFSIGKSTLILLLILGTFDYALGGILFIGSLHFIDSALAFLVLYSYPAMVVIAAVITGREKLMWSRILAVLLTFAGVALVLEAGAAVEGNQWLGVLMVIGAALVFTVYLMITEKLLNEIRPSTITFYNLLGAAVAMLLIIPFKPFDLAVVLQPENLLILAVVSIVSTALAIVFFMVGVKHIGASKAAIITTVEPVVVVLAAALLLGEQISPMQWLGMCLQMAGLLLVNRDEGKPLTDPEIV